MTDVVLIRLFTSEELIATQVGETEKNITIKDGLIIVPGQQGATVIPFNIFGKKDVPITISKDHILYITDPNEELKAQYESQFSGIVRPAEKRIIA